MEKGKLNCVCKQCGKKFHLPPSAIAKGQGKYCSIECKAQWQSAHMKGEDNPNWAGGKVEMKCEICGSAFLRGRYEIDDGQHKFCSRKCFGVWKTKHLLEHRWHGHKKELKTVVCEYCGKEFSVRKMSEDPNRFCSRACYGKWRSIHVRGKNSSTWNSVERKCERCGKTFYVQPSVLKRKGGGTYCSWECRRNRIEKTCKQCGKPISVQVCELSWGQGVYCSQECKAEWQSINRSGSNHPCYLGDDYNREYPNAFTEELKEKIRERENHVCFICGGKSKHRRLDIHHINYDKKNVDEGNLIALCQSCHSKTNYDREYWYNVFYTLCDFKVSEYPATGGIYV